MNSQDIFNKFSFQDILAYFLPGVASTLGIYTLLVLTGILQPIYAKPDIFSGILFFIICFIIGITISGLSHPIIRFLYWITKRENPETKVPKKFESDLTSALNSKLNLNIKNEWKVEYHIFCNVIVRELMPDSFSISYRQEGLRLMRTYMMFPIFIWTIIGLIYGIIQIEVSLPTGIIGIFLSLTFGILLLFNIWDRMHKNKERAISNILASIVCLNYILEEKKPGGSEKGNLPSSS